MNIPKSIKRGLLEKDKKALDLAPVINKSQVTISHWMTGKSLPKLEDIQKMANFFGVKVSVFISWGEK